MGHTINVRCTGCELKVDEISVGTGMHFYGRFFELRVFYCPSCETLHSANVLNHMASLREYQESLKERPDWNREEVLRHSDLVELFIRARRRPSCPACRVHLRGAVKLPKEGSDPGGKCPRCEEAKLQVTQGNLMFD